MSKQITYQDKNLFTDIQSLIEEARSAVGKTINVGLTIMHWKIGERINEEILKSERAEYGKAIVATMSQLSHFSFSIFREGNKKDEDF